MEEFKQLPKYKKLAIANELFYIYSLDAPHFEIEEQETERPGMIKHYLEELSIEISELDQDSQIENLIDLRTLTLSQKKLFFFCACFLATNCTKAMISGETEDYVFYLSDMLGVKRDDISTLIHKVSHYNKPNQTEYEYKQPNEVRLIGAGGYIAKDEPSNYILLYFEPCNSCRKIVVPKHLKESFDTSFFKTIVESTQRLSKNKGSYNLNFQKQEIIINFDNDPNDIQTFRCKIRKNGILIVNAFYGSEKREVREYVFDSGFKEKFLK